MVEAIYRNERIFARKFEVNFSAERITYFVRKFAKLEAKGAAKYRDFSSNIRDFFVKKLRKTANFGEIGLHYFFTQYCI